MLAMDKFLISTNLEDAELNYKALLINVTKKRKDYPLKLSSKLGYAIRLENKATEFMKVELPPRPPLDCNIQLPDENKTFCKTQSTLDELVKNVQSQLSQMSRISEGLDINNKNQDTNTIL